MGREGTYLDSSVLDGEGAGNLSGTTAVDDTVIADQVADDAEGVVQGSLSLVDEL